MNYSAEHDPILWAGAVNCLTCGRAAFPIDAAWAGDGVIIAAFARPCGHVPDEMQLIDLRAAGVRPDGRPAVLDHLAQYVTGRHCAGRNRKGQPCRAYAGPGSDYCHSHQPASAAGRR